MTTTLDGIVIPWLATLVDRLSAEYDRSRADVARVVRGCLADIRAAGQYAESVSSVAALARHRLDEARPADPADGPQTGRCPVCGSALTTEATSHSTHCPRCGTSVVAGHWG